MRLRPLVFALSLVICTLAHAKAGLSDLEIVDRVIVEKSTGQPTLVLLIDMPLEAEQTLPLVRKKLLRYQAFAVSGDLYAQFPIARRGPPVQVLLFYIPTTSSSVAPALEKIKEFSYGAGLEPVFRELGTREPLVLPSASAASEAKR